jgi:hypothetical protein
MISFANVHTEIDLAQGKNHFRLCLHLRVLIDIRDRTVDPRIDGL